jgi:hypothetical protein
VTRSYGDTSVGLFDSVGPRVDDCQWGQMIQALEKRVLLSLLWLLLSWFANGGTRWTGNREVYRHACV